MTIDVFYVHCMDHSTDRLALLAARAVFDGTAATVQQAIDALHEGPPPSLARVRKHLEAMQQEAVGLGDWWRTRLALLEVILELAETIEFASPEATVVLTGSTAQGHVDAHAAATARVIGVDAPTLLDALEAQGVAPPEVRSEITTLGSIAVAQCSDARGVVLDLRIVPDVPQAHAPVNLVTGEPISVQPLDRFRSIVDAARAATPEM